MSDILRAHKLVLEARKAIATLAPDAAAVLAEAEALMYRELLAKPAGRRVDTKMARLICEFVEQFPELSEFEIARRST